LTTNIGHATVPLTLLKMTTALLRIVVLLGLFLVWAPIASAWSWPVEGPVLQEFSYDEAHPYAAGQHRGIDIGADAAGETVVAPEAGVISFAGTVPTSGKSVTIDTADGYSVTLTHLGSILVAKGTTVDEKDAIGTIGPSGTPDEAGPYLHLGIRLTADADGYLDPLGFLPPAADGGGATGESDPPATQPGSGTGSSAPPASAPSPPPQAPASAPVATTPEATVVPGRGSVSRHGRERARGGRSELRPTRSPRRPAVAETTVETRSRVRVFRHRAEEPASASRRPVIETAAPAEPTGLDAGHEIRERAPVAQLSPSRRGTPRGVLPLLLNGAAALVALAAVLIAARSRHRRRSAAGPAATAEVLRLPRRVADERPVSRAA
jgi:hypothetical protein